MNLLDLETINLELKAIKMKKQIIEKYAGSDETVYKIMVHEARAGIKDCQESLSYFSNRKKRN